MVGGTERLVDLQDIAAVVGDADRIEAECRERRRGRTSNVELDDRGLDGGTVGELDHMVAALPSTRAHALGPSVLAHVDSGFSKRLREKGGASGMIGRVHLA